MTAHPYRHRYHASRISGRPFNPELDDDGPEPNAHEYDAARAELGAWASDAQVTQRAFELMREDVHDHNMMAADDEAESRLDDYTTGGWDE